MLADVGTERAVLSGVCKFGKEGLSEVDDIINIYTFTDTSNQMLYKCLCEALRVNKTLDIAGLITASQDLSLYDVVAKSKKDLEYISSLFSFPIKFENLRTYAKRLGKLEFARKAQQKHKEAYDSLSEIKGTETLDTIVSMSEKPIFDLILDVNRGKSDSPETLTEGMDEYIEFLLNNVVENVGIPTPWPIYNAAIGGGLRRGGVTMIGARPKIGKSTLTKELALHTSNVLKIPTLVLDTEMDKKDQLIRSLASTSKIAINMIETGKFNKSDLMKNMVLNAYHTLKGNDKFFYKSIAGRPFEEVMSIIRRWILKEVGFDDSGKTKDCLVIYDYFKLMDKSQLNNLKEYEAMGYQISSFTDFTKEFDFPVMAFVQLNRQEDISQSDRLRWLCQSYTAFLPKDAEMVAADGGLMNGNRLLRVESCRFGPGIPSNDYINMMVNGDYNIAQELGLKSQLETKDESSDDGETT